MADARHTIEIVARDLISAARPLLGKAAFNSWNRFGASALRSIAEMNGGQL